MRPPISVWVAILQPHTGSCGVRHSVEAGRVATRHSACPPTKHRRRTPLTVEVPPQYGSAVKVVDQRGERDGVWDRASLSGRYAGPVRGESRGGAPLEGQPAGRPDLPRRWPVGWRLDDFRRPRVEGELGEV